MLLRDGLKISRTVIDYLKKLDGVKKVTASGSLDLPDDILSRLDLTDLACMRAAKKGVGVVINTDAHSLSHMHYMAFGIGQARRGWLEPKDVLNTRSLKQITECLKGG